MNSAKKKFTISSWNGSRSAHEEVRHSAGCGHHLFPRHAHRPRRASRRLGATALPPDLPAARLGRARPARHPLLAAGRARPSSSCPSNVDTAEIDSIGITNQRETTIVWDRTTGEPIMNAIVWQCRRTAPMVEAIASDPATAAEITARTGLVPDAYFSASKLAWILGEVPGARARAEAGELCLRHRGQLAHLEAHLRGRPRHRRDQRQPHHALQHSREPLGSRFCWSFSASPRPSFPRCAPLPAASA